LVRSVINALFWETWDSESKRVLMERVRGYLLSGEGVQIDPPRSRQVLGLYGRAYEPSRHLRDSEWRSKQSTAHAHLVPSFKP
jgi:surface antigen